MNQAPKKIVFFNRKPRPLGNYSIEIYFQEIRKYINEHFEVIFLEMPYVSSGFFRRLANAIFCYLNQGDVNHITGDIHYVATFLKKRKTVLTVLDCGMLKDKAGFGKYILKLFWFSIPLKKAKIITAISEATKNDIGRYIKCDLNKIEVVYVCINPIFQRNLKEFYTEEPRILQIGTATNKNLQRLIPALETIKCQLVIIGKVTEDILELIKVNKINVEIIDWRLTDEEIVEQYSLCDIVSFTSTLEGFGMPIIEGNAIGRIVVTSNISSMKEVANDAAILVDPYDIQSIENGFKKAIYDKETRNHIIENGFKNSKKFNPKFIANQYISIYNKIG